MEASLVHFGCGALGLGLVLPELDYIFSGIEIYLCNRNSNDPHSARRNKFLQQKKHFYIRKGTSDFPLKFQDFIYFENLEKIISIVEADKLIIVTTALKESGIGASLDVFCELLIARDRFPTSFPLIFVACENAISSTAVKSKIFERLYKKFGKDFRFQNDIVFIDCVVDRICNKPRILRDNNLIVRTEEYGQWVLSNDHLHSITDKKLLKHILDRIGHSKSIEIEKDIDFFVRRKKWLVNSMHQLMALFAHYNRYVEIDYFLSTEFGRLFLNGVANEVLKVYLFNEKNASEIVAKTYMEKIKDRLLAFPSSTDTALTRFTELNSLPDFFKDFQRKIGEPTVKYLELTNRPLCFIPILQFKISELVASRNFVLVSDEAI